MPDAVATVDMPSRLLNLGAPHDRRRMPVVIPRIQERMTPHDQTLDD